MEKLIAGIDYGSKMAGTTVLCYNDEDGLVLLTSEKKKSADDFLLHHLNVVKPDIVMFDAPLSLPGAYFGWKDYHNFHYRRCDKALNAMSPMFLGGLTARAMSLKSAVNGDFPFLETYPGAFMKTFFPEFKAYKKEQDKLKEALENLRGIFDFPELKTSLNSWHSFDALVCWISGLRYATGEAECIGEKKEGLIYY